jgi:hypothetical protein
MPTDIPSYSLLRLQYRLSGIRAAIFCGIVSAVFGIAAYVRGHVLGLSPNTAWRVPLLIGLAWLLGSLALVGFRDGFVLGGAEVIERAKRPTAFWCQISLMVIFALAFLTLGFSPIRLSWLGRDAV